MTMRIVDARPGEVVVTMNEKNLLKFTGWVEAHRPPGDWEPSFLGACLSALNCAREADAQRATVTCHACGTKRDLSSPDVFYDPDAGSWFCQDGDECDERRAAVAELAAELAEEARS